MDTTIDHPSEATLLDHPSGATSLPDAETLLAILPSAGSPACMASEQDFFAGDDELDDDEDVEDSNDEEDEEDDFSAHEDEDDEVDEASEESFPASDPPAFTPLHIGS